VRPADSAAIARGQPRPWPSDANNGCAAHRSRGELMDRSEPRRLGLRQPDRRGHGTRCAASRVTQTSRSSGPEGSEVGSRLRAVDCRQPDLLLRDEPTPNHLDAESVQWLESSTSAGPGVGAGGHHDRYFLDNVRGTGSGNRPCGRLYPYEGKLSTYLETKDERFEGRGPRAEGRQGARRRLPGRARLGATKCEGRQAKSKPGFGTVRGDGGRGGKDPQGSISLRSRSRPASDGIRRWCRRRALTRASTIGC